MELGRPLKVEAQSVDTELTGQETAALAGTPSLIEPTEVHDKALQQIRQLRTHLEAQRQHLETTGRTLQQRFEQVRNWWQKEEQLETTVARMAIAADHLEDKIRQASPEQVRQHLLKELSQLSENIEKIQLAGASVERFIQPEQQVEHEDLFLVEVAGAKKQWNDTLADQQGKLGKYGQDCVRSNPELGISVVADGMSSGMGSFEVARRASRRGQAILEDIPLELCSSLEEVQFFVQGELNGILNDLNEMASTEAGGTTLLAARYIEKFDAIVMIDLGDCEACAVTGSDVLSIKTVRESMRTPPHIIKTSGVEAVPRFFNPTDESIVKVVSLGEFRQTHPGEPLHLLLATDGLKNNTGKSLQEQAAEIIKHGMRATVEKVGSKKDDITLIDMDLSLPALEQQVEQRQAMGG